MNRWRAVCVVAALWLAAPLHAADVDKAARERITAERTAADATLAQRERECTGRFVVTACVEDARRDHRATVARLRRQQALLDESEARQRAADRQQRISAKQDAAAEAPAARAPRTARAARPPVPADAAASVPMRAEKPDARQSQEASRAAAYAARVQAAEARRAAVERRNAEREKKSNKARPLPDPANGATR